MLKEDKIDIPAKEIENFPILMMEPWRVEELVAEETAIQRYRLFRAVAWTHIGTTLMMGLYTLIKGYDITAIIISACYFLLLIVLMMLTSNNRQHTLRYSTLMALLDIFILGYATIIFNNILSLALLFFSMLLSAMLLTLPRLLVVIMLAAVVVVLSWSSLSEDTLYYLYNNKIDFNILQDYLNIPGYSPKTDQLLTLIVGLFVLSIVTNRLAAWSFQNEVKAQFRYKQLRQLLTFNRSIIEHLKSGVLVLTTNGKVVSINQRALELLNHNSSDAIIDLRDLSEELSSRFRHWQSTGLEIGRAYRHNDHAEEVFISFSGFGSSAQSNVAMMTMESVNDTLQQSQEAKLSALGRLTAGVAHEIRNPLSSIGSAAQLLTETSQERSHQKLSNLILKNVKRTNQIISDILGLFKETRSDRQLLPVADTLEQFCQEFKQTHTDKNFSIELLSQDGEEDDDRPLFFLFDAGQFEQILWNLLQNSLKYAQAEPLLIKIQYKLSLNQKNIYIDVIDNGVGIKKEKIAQIFEPFYTGGSGGSGLGLYLVRELCNSNSANIVYLSSKNEETRGACFRITTQAYFSNKVKTN